MSVLDGISFAHTAVQFASLGLKAGQQNWHFPQIHLFALAIELGFKSLALRSGATVAECKAVGHDPSKMIALIERHGGIVSPRIKQSLSDKEWFTAFFLMSRYPALSELNSSLDKSILMHPDYPEMIAEILEARCRWPLSFHRGCALEEIKNPSNENTFTTYTEKSKNEPNETT